MGVGRRERGRIRGQNASLENSSYTAWQRGSRAPNEGVEALTSCSLRTRAAFMCIHYNEIRLKIQFFSCHISSCQ